ncbi:hypothetical protein Q8W87_28550 [Pseudomonas aeruginosa]|nr:hypothetical protein [Pseudomonas aeruginosa]MDU0704062.1 hypothetical protein [Pseudomonas aeruginosa]
MTTGDTECYFLSERQFERVAIRVRDICPEADWRPIIARGRPQDAAALSFGRTARDISGLCTRNAYVTEWSEWRVIQIRRCNEDKREGARAIRHPGDLFDIAACRSAMNYLKIGKFLIEGDTLIEIAHNQRYVGQSEICFG